METVVHPESGLTKAVFTDDDLDSMSWHHCRIHALALTGDEGPPEHLPPDEYAEWADLDPTAPSALALHFDLDYIVGQVPPKSPGHSYTFWVSPATLIFFAALNVDFDLGTSRPLTTLNLHRLGPLIPHHETRWHLEGEDFDLRFVAWNFRMILRRPPRLGERVLRMAHRGGISFETRPFA